MCSSGSRYERISTVSSAERACREPRVVGRDDCDGAEPELARRAKHAQRDLTAVRDEHLVHARDVSRPSSANDATQIDREREVGDGVGGGVSKPAAAGGAERLARRPGEVHERERVAVVEAARLRHVGQQRQCGREGGAEGEARQHDDDGEHERLARPGQHGREDRRRRRGRRGSGASCRACRTAARRGCCCRTRAPPCTGRRRRSPRRCSRGATAGAARARTGSRTAGPASSTSQKHTRSCRSRNAANSAESGCGSSGGAAGVVAANATSPSDATPTDTERPAGPGERRDAAEHGPEERPADRCRERRADQRPAPLDRGRSDQPGEARPSTRTALAIPWTNRAANSCHAWSARPKTTTQTATRAQADDDGGLHAEPGCDRSARDRPDQHSERIGRRQRARARLAQPQGVGVVRQQRGESREEEHVDEDDGSRQKEDALHGLRRYSPTLV